MIIDELYLQGLSTRQVAKKVGKSPATIQRYLAKKGLIRSISESLMGSKHPKYKGGHITDRGYRLIYVKGIKIYEHRHVVENALGRKLKRTEYVHHIDHNKLNNSIYNLKITDIVEHQKLHVIPTLSKPCLECGAHFNRNSFDSYKVWGGKKYCSMVCKGKGHSKWMKNRYSQPSL